MPADQPAHRLPTRAAALALGLTVIGAPLAIVFDLPSKLVLGEAQEADLGIEVLWQGSAISAPLPPVVGFAAGWAMTRRDGWARTAGLVVLSLVGLLVLVFSVLEFTTDAAFGGFRQALFVAFNAGYAVLGAVMAGGGIAALVTRKAPAAP